MPDEAVTYHLQLKASVAAGSGSTMLSAVAWQGCRSAVQPHPRDVVRSGRVYLRSEIRTALRIKPFAAVSAVLPAASTVQAPNAVKYASGYEDANHDD